MSFANVVEKSWDKNILLVALIELTYDCNLDCEFCYNDRALPGARLDLDDYEKIFDELEAMGVLNVVLSGGEPMVHPRFWQIGASARRHGFVVRLKTNGHLLRGDTIARLQREVDPFVIEVSLHGASAEVHDRQTRLPGSFVRLVANLNEMRAAGLRVRINSTLTRYNEHEIEGMFAIAESLGYPLTIDPDVTPRDDGDLSPLSLVASDKALRTLAARGYVPGPAKEAACDTGSPKHCGAGSATLCIDPVGNVYPCVQWRRRVGSVKDGLASLWQGAPGLEEIRRLTVEVKSMISAQGERGQHMGFCPGTAESRGGSALAPYDATTRRADAALVVRGRLRVIA